MINNKYFDREKLEQVDKKDLHIFKMKNPAKVINDYFAGMSDKELAEKYNKSERTIRHYLSELRVHEIIPSRNDIDFDNVNHDFIHNEYFNKEGFEDASNSEMNVFKLDNPIQFIHDYFSGMTDSELGEKYDKSERTIRNYLKEMRNRDIIPHRYDIDFDKINSSDWVKDVESSVFHNRQIDESKYINNDANVTRSELIKLLNIHGSRSAVAKVLDVPYSQISSLVDHYDILDSKKLSARINTSLSDILSDFNPLVPKIKHTKHGVSLAILCTDWHVGKEIVDEKGNCKFNVKIFQKRIDELISELFKIIDVHLKSHLEIDEAVIIAAGDFSNGEQIYPTQVYETDLAPPDQTMIAAKSFIKIINSLLKRGIPVRFKGVMGNHGRSGRDTDPESNWDLMIYKIIEFWQMITNPENFDLEYSSGEFLNFYIRNWNFHLRHKSYNQDETPAGRSKIQGWKSLHGADVVVSGHYHHWSMNERRITGSSLCGPDGLAERMAVNTGAPSQLMWVVSDTHSHTNVFPIEVDID